MNKKLDFILAGDQRCGTTWLYSQLNQHEDVFLPDTKELHFFDKFYDKGLDYYHSHFDARGDNKLIGEATPDYLCFEVAAERIAAYNPNIKLIFILRDPVERAYSAYWMFRHFFGDISFEQALTEYDGLIRCGLYEQHLLRWLEHIPKEQMLVLLYDDLKNSEASVIRKVLTFLGLEQSRLGLTQAASNQVVNAAIFSDFQNWLKKMHLLWVIELVKMSPLNSIIRGLYYKNRFGGYPKMNPEIRGRLSAIFSESNKNVSEMFDLDIKSWS